MYDAQPAGDRYRIRVQAGDAVAECDRKIARYREAFNAGADPVVVAGGRLADTAEVVLAGADSGRWTQLELAVVSRLALS